MAMFTGNMEIFEALEGGWKARDGGSTASKVVEGVYAAARGSQGPSRAGTVRVWDWMAELGWKLSR